MPKRQGRLELIEPAEESLKDEQEDIPALFEPVVLADGEVPVDSENLASPVQVTRRPRSRLGRLWARFRHSSPWQVLQVMTSLVVAVVMVTSLVSLLIFIFSPVGRFICTGIGLTMALAVLIGGFFRGGGSFSD